MPGKKRKILALAILGAGFAVSAYIVGSGGNENELSTSSAAQRLGSFLDFGAPGQGAAGDAIYTGENLTENVVRQYQLETIRLNQESASSPEGGIAMPGEEILSEIIAQEAAKGISFKSYGMKDIKITSRDGLDAARVYLESLETAFNKNPSKPKTDFYTAVAEAVENDKDAELRFHKDNASTLIENLLLIEAPKKWAPFHLEFLNALEKRRTAAQIVLNRNTDYLKAVVLVFDYLDEIIEEEERVYLSLVKLIEEL